MGAEVVKVEPLAGDNTRQLGVMRNAGMGALFLNCNRGKKSVSLDLKHPDGLKALHRLTGKADVMLHNMRADAAERLGIGYTTLQAINPRLVYCSAYGYGAKGRYAAKPAYDDVIQAGCGMAAMRARIACSDWRRIACDSGRRSSRSYSSMSSRIRRAPTCVQVTLAMMSPIT